MSSKIGDWQKALRTINEKNLKFALGTAYANAAVAAGLMLKKAIQKGIKSQGASFGQRFKPLHPFTIERKGSAKALIDKGDLFNSVTYVLVSRHDVFVGVPRTASGKGGNIVNIAAILETGTSINLRKNPQVRKYLTGAGMKLKSDTKVVTIPPRPFVKPAVDKEMPAVLAMFKQTTSNAIKTLMK